MQATLLGVNLLKLSMHISREMLTIWGNLSSYAIQRLDVTTYVTL
jgi:hypothetical protein